MSSHSPQLRALYRSVIRELPSRRGAKGQSILSNPSKLQQHIRGYLSSDATSTPNRDGNVATRLLEAEQFLQYVQAQRNYVTLVERYNPGMNLTEEERVRLSARRVGMDLPPEYSGSTEQK